MLARPEFGTREHILLWLSSKPPEETYVWKKADICACAQYEAEVPEARRLLQTERWEILWGPHPYTLNYLARECPSHTFGALYEMARKTWSKENAS